MLFPNIQKVLLEIPMFIHGNSNEIGQYSVYGYEATKIALKKPLPELNNEHTFTCGHEVPEQIIKMMIQLTLISMIKQRLGVLLRPTLEYLHWIENSQYHKLLH